LKNLKLFVEYYATPLGISWLMKSGIEKGFNFFTIFGR